MKRQRGFTYIETILAGFMMISSLMLVSKLMAEPVEVSINLTPRSRAQQNALYIQQAQTDVLRSTFAYTLENTPTPAPTPSPSPTPTGADPALTYQVTVMEESMVASPAPAGSSTLNLYACPNFVVNATTTADARHKVYIDEPPNTEARQVTALTRGTGSCTLTLGSALAHATPVGAVVTPVYQETASSTPTYNARDVLSHFLTVLVTYPRHGSTLSAAVASGATQISVFDTSGFAINSLLRIDKGTASGQTTEYRRISTVSGITIGLSSALTSAHSLYASVAAGAALSNSPAAGKTCLIVDAPANFAANRAAQVDVDASMESAMVSCVGSTCTCDEAGAHTASNRVVLLRPLRRAHAAGVPVLPALYSTNSFSAIVTGGGQYLGD